MDLALADRCAAMARAGIDREYPNQVALVLRSDADARPPRQLTPLFFGCYDWHSAVHAHWTLVRLARSFPQATFAADARSALARRITVENVAGEVAYLAVPQRAGFERPYGLAWLLQLVAELRAWRDDDDACVWAKRLEPLERLAIARFAEWLPRLSHPIRSGEHAQTAFAMGLALDAARTAGDVDFERLLTTRTLDFHARDRDAPLHLEPSGHDFLSPSLAVADLLRRTLAPPEFAKWLTTFFGREWNVATDFPLAPVSVTDPSDGKLVHLDGLNLSRAWMLEGIVHGLPIDDPRRASLTNSAAALATAGLYALDPRNYAGAHWLGTFATYLATRRGLSIG